MTSFFPSNVSRPIASEKLAWRIVEKADNDAGCILGEGNIGVFVDGLIHLHSTVTIEGRRSSRATRIQVNNVLRSLTAKITPPQQIFEHPLAAEVMYIAWLDFQASSPLAANETTFNTIHRSPRRISALVNHFQLRIAEFDQLNPSEQSDWFFGGKCRRENATRKMLYPFLRRGRPESVDILAVRIIAALYELAYARRFAVVWKRPVPKGAGHKQGDFGAAASPRDQTSRYHGPGIRFACAVIDALQLSNYFAFYRSENYIRYPANRRSQYSDPKLDRQQRLDSVESGLDNLVANRIGDAWKNESRKIRRAFRQSQQAAGRR